MFVSNMVNAFPNVLVGRAYDFITPLLGDALLPNAGLVGDPLARSLAGELAPGDLPVAGLLVLSLPAL